MLAELSSKLPFRTVRRVVLFAEIHSGSFQTTRRRLDDLGTDPEVMPILPASVAAPERGAATLSC
jgi:hypothetical protein